MSLRSLYRVLAPLSPYRPDPQMPSFRLFTRINDNNAHGLWRIAFMGMWAGFGGLAAAAYSAFFNLVVLKASPNITLGFLIVMSLFALLLWKVLGVTSGPYKVDVLDWACDAVACGGAGAYLTTFALAHQHQNPYVYAALFALWLVTYPWSTPA